MPKVHEGQLDAGDRYFGIAVSRFNDLVTTRLLDGALDCIQRHGGDDDGIEIAWVPGAFELPIAAKKLAECDGLHPNAVLRAVEASRLALCGLRPSQCRVTNKGMCACCTSTVQV